MSDDLRSDALVLFGASGDLARKKLPALYRLAEAGRLNLPIIGVALDDWDDDVFRDRARTAIEAAIGDVDTQ